MNAKVTDDVFGLGGGPLRVDLLPNGFDAELALDFYVDLNDGSGITVPTGFKTDFASVPRAFWRLVPPWGRYSPAAVVHDYLYYMHKKLGMTRKQADDIFLELMKRLDVKKWKRQSMYWAVRVCGWKAWGDYE